MSKNENPKPELTETELDTVAGGGWKEDLKREFNDTFTDKDGKPFNGV